MLVAQQHLVGKAAALRMNQRNLPSPLTNQIVAGGFGSEGMIELNAVVALAVEAVHQHHVRAVNIQGKTRADDQHVIAQPAGQLLQRAHHAVAGVGEAQQQVLLVLAELFFQGVEIAGGLIDVVLGADDADTAGGLAGATTGLSCLAGN